MSQTYAEGRSRRMDSLEVDLEAGHTRPEYDAEAGDQTMEHIETTKVEEDLEGVRTDQKTVGEG